MLILMLQTGFYCLSLVFSNNATTSISASIRNSCQVKTTLMQAQAENIIASTRIRKNFDPCAYACVWVRPFSQWNKSACACVATENQTLDLAEHFVTFINNFAGTQLLEILDIGGMVVRTSITIIIDITSTISSSNKSQSPWLFTIVM